MKANYDIIICGAGLAGLSFLKILFEKKQFNQSILIIDKTLKNKNDKTWSFWAKDNTLFKNIPHKSWSEYVFQTEKDYTKLNFEPYKYYSIKSIDFYNYTIGLLNKMSNVEFLHANVEQINEQANCVETDKGKFKAALILNSAFNVETFKFDKNANLLYQHFKGFVIETENYEFENAVYLMDYRTQQFNDTRFFYILPYSQNKALIEYTVFSSEILSQKEYDAQLNEYIKNTLNVKSFKIEETEFGVIPMTDQKFEQPKSKAIINIGTNGGFVKPSSGYSFVRQQEKLQALAEFLIAQNFQPKSKFNLESKLRFRLYDSTILEALKNNRIVGRDLFKKHFMDLPQNLILKFLNEKTNIWEELKIISTGPAILVLSFFKQLFRIKKI